MAQMTSMQWIFIIPVLPYFFTIIAIWKNLILLKEFKPSPLSCTRVSVIVACKNEETELPSLLADLLSQNYSAELYEIIIVDDHSNDSTLIIASSFEDSGLLKVLNNKGNGKKSAILTGIEASQGELIITTDADCQMGKDWIGSFVSLYNESGPDLIIGPVVLESKGGFFRKFQELEFFSLQGITAGTASMANPVMCNGANMAFTRDAYYRHFHKLHNEIASGDDIFLLHCIKKDDHRAVRFLKTEYAVVTTRSSESVNGFLRQRARWLSKTGSYSDSFTIFLGIVTFVTIIDLIVLLLAGIFNIYFFILFGIVFMIKSLPDFLLLLETTGMHKKTGLLKWFLPSQVVYPFYVTAVVVMAIFRKSDW